MLVAMTIFDDFFLCNLSHSFYSISVLEVFLGPERLENIMVLFSNVIISFN